MSEYSVGKSKCVILFKPCQSGKTSHMLDELRDTENTEVDKNEVKKRINNDNKLKNQANKKIKTSREDTAATTSAGISDCEDQDDDYYDDDGVLSVINKKIADVKFVEQNKIHFILCNNRLRETTQLETRLQNYGIEQFIIFNSITKKNKDNVFRALLTMPNINEQINKVIICTNATRINDIDKIIEDISNMNENVIKDDKRKNFHFWVDEIDANIDILKPFLIKWSKNKFVERFYFMTATPERLFEEKYKEFFDEKLNFISLSSTYNQDYYMLSKCKFEFIKSKSKDINEIIIEQIHKIKKTKDLNGTKWFIPTKLLTKFHNEIKEKLKKEKFIVLVINKDGNNVWIPNQKEPEKLENDKNKEFSAIIADFYNKKNVIKSPFAITGNNCLNRGITIQSDEFMFDYAILAEDLIVDDKPKSKDNLYQLAGRLCGPRKNQGVNHTETIIYTSEKMKQILLEREQKAEKVAKEAFKISQNENDPVPFSKEEFEKL